MKKLLIIALVAIGFGTHAQIVTPVTGNTNVQVTQAGVISINGSVVGSASNGLIKNPNDVTIGSYMNDGTIKNANNVVVGYFRENYEVANANNVVIGSLNSLLEVRNASNNVIGSYIDTTPPIYNAIAHFFLQP